MYSNNGVGLPNGRGARDALLFWTEFPGSYPPVRALLVHSSNRVSAFNLKERIGSYRAIWKRGSRWRSGS